MADYVRITNMNSQNLIGKNPFGGDRLFEREYKQGLIKEAEARSGYQLRNDYILDAYEWSSDKRCALCVFRG